MSKPANLTLSGAVPTLNRQEASTKVREILMQTPWMDAPEVLADATAFTVVSVLPEGGAQEQLIDLHAAQIKAMVKAFYVFLRRPGAETEDEDVPAGNA